MAVTPEAWTYVSGFLRIIEDFAYAMYNIAITLWTSGARGSVVG
jgi:hypothetical protein